MGITDRAEPVARGRFDLDVGGKKVKVSNLDKVLYPETGFTKGDLIDYYEAVSPVLLPHLKDRPVTLRRFPGGVKEAGFWEKRCPEHRPDWVETTPVWSGGADETIDYCVMKDAATLVWAANLAAIELHTSLAKAATRATPKSVVFDLDPGAPADVIDCAEIALTIRDTLTELGLACFVKTSGSKGLQLYLPLNTPASYGETRKFAHSVARSFEAQMPDQAISKMKKTLRPGKVFIDWSQNSEYKTTVCVYSVRSRPTPSVSMPVGWEEVEGALDSGDSMKLSFSPEEALRRVARDGDLFRDLLRLKQKLP